MKYEVARILVLNDVFVAVAVFLLCLVAPAWAPGDSLSLRVRSKHQQVIFFEHLYSN